MTLNLLPEEIKEYIYMEFGSDEKPKNDRMHFADYDKAKKCVEGLRDLIPKAIKTGNLHLSQ